MKKIQVLSAIIIGVLLLSSVGVMAKDTWEISPSTQKFLVDGKAVKANALNINGRNYLQVSELAELLGIGISYDETTNTVSIDQSRPFSSIANAAVSGDVVINLSNNFGQLNIAESGSFQAENNRTLTLSITSNIKGGNVDLFLFDPNGKEQRITIGSANATKEIALSEGLWQYNCSGIFKDGGNVSIVGVVH